MSSISFIICRIHNDDMKNMQAKIFFVPSKKLRDKYKYDIPPLHFIHLVPTYDSLLKTSWALNLENVRCAWYLRYARCYLFANFMFCLFVWEYARRVTQAFPQYPWEPPGRDTWPNRQSMLTVTFWERISPDYFNVFDSHKRGEKDHLNRQHKLTAFTFAEELLLAVGFPERWGWFWVLRYTGSTRSHSRWKMNNSKYIRRAHFFPEVWIMFIFSPEAVLPRAYFILRWLSIWTYQSTTLHSMWFTEQIHIFFNVKQELVEDSSLQRFAQKYPASEEIFKPLDVFVVLQNHHHNHPLLVRVLQVSLASQTDSFNQPYTQTCRTKNAVWWLSVTKCK